jgi:hypothetical protein
MGASMAAWGPNQLTRTETRSPHVTVTVGRAAAHHDQPSPAALAAAAKYRNQRHHRLLRVTGTSGR